MTGSTGVRPAATTSWLRRFTPTPDPLAAPVIVCPHAGAGAAAYRPLAEALVRELEVSSPADPAPADVVVAQYPGRQDRASESAPETVLGYAKGMLPEVEAMVRGEGGAAPRPVTLMGHSMGGLIVYEIARLLEARRLPVRLLVVSGTNSPQFTAEVPDHPTEDEALLEHMARINGTDPRILGNQQILRMALPVMKADYAAFDRYRDEDTTLLSAPILALGGASDGGVSPVSLRGWAERTSSTSRVSVFQGDHFFITHATDAVARTIAGEVAACV